MSIVLLNVFGLFCRCFITFDSGSQIQAMLAEIFDMKSTQF